MLCVCVCCVCVCLCVCVFVCHVGQVIRCASLCYVHMIPLCSDLSGSGSPDWKISVFMNQHIVISMTERQESLPFGKLTYNIAIEHGRL